MLKFTKIEQMKFIEQLKKHLLAGKTAVENPKFVTLLGAKGSGKTTLGQKLKNTVLVSPDEVIGYYLQKINADPRTYRCNEEERYFLSKVKNDIFVAAIKNKYNLAYDSGLTDNTEKLIAIMEQKGYASEMIAIIADKNTTVLNVAERKLEFDEKFAKFKAGKGEYPEGLNPTSVGLGLAEKSAKDVVDFLVEMDFCGKNFKVVEYGNWSKVSYDTQNAKEPFVAYLDNYYKSLPQKEVHLPRLDALIKQAAKQKNYTIFNDLREFKESNYVAMNINKITINKRSLIIN